MKKSVLLSISLLIAALLPVNAASSEDTSKAKAALIERVETCEAILQQFMGRPETAIPRQVLAKARAIVIVNQVKAGAIIGIQDGWGVMLVKRPNGKWSLPALVKSGEASLGFQLGANKVEIIYVITDDQTPRMLFNRRVNFGVDAKAVAGPRAAESQAVTKDYIDSSVLVYSKKSGLYAGATVKTGYLKRDDDSNRILYNTNYSFPELLYSEWVKPIPEVEPLMQMVTKIAP
jgi:lipid-binding SYLF domain-containing protein